MKNFANANLRLYVRLKAYHPHYINRFLLSVQEQLRYLGLSDQSLVFLPKRVERFTVLRSPHVDKKARDQFERVTHQRLLVINFSKNQTLLVYRLLRHISNSALGIQISARYSSRVAYGVSRQFEN
jgi:small subunit ribosomal protein S10